MQTNKQVESLSVGNILDKYRIDKIITSLSPMKNRVYFGTVIDNEQKIVIKTCHARNRRYARRLRREYNILTKINHPNVVKKFDWIEDKTMLCLITKFEGLRFHDYIKMHAPLPISEIKSLLLSILNTLEYIHNTHQLEHRDLHVNNIVINDSHTPCLIDFSITRKRQYSMKIWKYLSSMLNLSHTPYCFPNDIRRFAGLAFIGLTGSAICNVNKIKNIPQIKEKIMQARADGYNEEILQMVEASMKLKLITNKTIQAWHAVLSKN